MVVETINYYETLNEDNIRENTRIEAKKLQQEVERQHGNLTIEVKQGDSLGSIVRNEIFKYYPNLSDEDKKVWTLIKPVVDEIKKQNNIADGDDIKAGTKLGIDMSKVTPIIDDYLFSINGNLEIPEDLDVEIKNKDTLGSIVRSEIFKYYPNLTEKDKNNRKLIKSIVDEIKKQNNISGDKIKAGTKLSINMLNIVSLIDNYLSEQHELNNDDNGIPESFTYTFKKGDNLPKVIKENVYKYYPELTEILDQGELNKLMQEIAKKVMELNGIKKEKDIAVGREITFNMIEITEIINKFKSKHVDKIPNTLKYTIQQGDSLGSIVRNEIFKYYPNLTSEDKSWALTNDIIKEVKRQNNISGDKIKAGDELNITMGKVTKIIQDYLSKESFGASNEEIETVGTNKYITLSKISDFQNGKGLVERIKNSTIKNKVESSLLKGKKILIPSYTEKENSKIMKLEEIINPEKTIDNKLKGKKFVLDPGHGFEDSGALGLINTGDNIQTVTCESAISMDVTYRVAKLLKSHGATVEFTHYIPTRGIRDDNDLPPCLQYGSWKTAKHQDKWRGQTENVTGRVGDSSINKRYRIANEINKNGNVDMLISMHMNSGGGKLVKIDDRDPQKTTSERFSGHLKNNGFGETIHVPNPKETGLGVLHYSECPSVLVEMGNIGSDADSARFRSRKGRQKKAEQLVDAMIKYYVK